MTAGVVAVATTQRWTAAWQLACVILLAGIAGGLLVLAYVAQARLPAGAGGLVWALAAVAAMGLAYRLGRRLTVPASTDQTELLALARSEQQLRAVLDNATLAVF